MPLAGMPLRDHSVGTNYATTVGTLAEYTSKRPCQCLRATVRTRVMAATVETRMQNSNLCRAMPIAAVVVVAADPVRNTERK
jgi:hypothetical protein